MPRRDTADLESLNTNADLQAHFNELGAEVTAEEMRTTPAGNGRSERHPFQRLKDELDNIQDELENRHASLSVVTRQAAIVAKPDLEWDIACAHVQRGSYPWTKLAGPMAATLAGAPVPRRLPRHGIATAAISLIAARLHAKSRPWEKPDAI
jgi:hypothetical protein